MHCCRVRRVEDLGHGSIQHLQTAEDKLDLASSVMSLLALVPSAVQPKSCGLAMDADKALEELRSVPVLADLEEWLQWDTRYKASLGSLQDFVQTHGEPSPPSSHRRSPRLGSHLQHTILYIHYSLEALLLLACSACGAAACSVNKRDPTDNIRNLPETILF